MQNKIKSQNNEEKNKFAISMIALATTIIKLLSSIINLIEEIYKQI